MKEMIRKQSLSGRLRRRQRLDVDRGLTLGRIILMVVDIFIRLFP
ncbi:hypothetical protein [Micromonospora aurantiaca]